jgi:aminopeptidase N
MTRDAEMSTADYVTLVLSGVGRETDSSVTRTLLRQAETATMLYSAPAKRDAARRRLADGFLALLTAAEPGSDSQLQLARAFAAAACSDEHVALVAGVLDGSAPIEGLTIDTDLRWHLLHQLAAAGRADAAAIDAEITRDDTATGRRQAAAALAARPLPEAKQAAFDSVMDDDSLPNAIQTATVAGFAQPAQEDLLRPFVAPYFARLREIWGERTNETAQNIVIGLFPTLIAEQSTVDAADAWLGDNEDAVPALRRLVLESRDGVARALRAQARDAQG